MVSQNGQPKWAFERDSGRVWTVQSDQPEDLTKLYVSSGRNIDQTALRLLRLTPT